MFAQESLEKVAIALKDELSTPNIELHSGVYSQKTDREIEAAIHSERMTVDVIFNQKENKITGAFPTYFQKYDRSSQHSILLSNNC